MIEIRNVSRSFDGGRTWALRDVSASIEEGTTLAILGSSGSGKSTLLRMINRTDQPDEGEVLLRGRPVTDCDPLELKRSIGYVLQDVGLFANMSVSENVEVVPRLLGWTRPRRRSRVEEVLQMVGLHPREFGHRHVATLSGGQRQRIGIARALAARPSILLMDEPFGALDAVVRSSLHDELDAIRQVVDATIVLVTHDPVEAIRLGHRISVMHEGRVVRSGIWTEILEDPADPYVEALVHRVQGQARLLQGENDRG